MRTGGSGWSHDPTGGRDRAATRRDGRSIDASPIDAAGEIEVFATGHTCATSPSAPRDGGQDPPRSPRSPRQPLGMFDDGRGASDRGGHGRPDGGRRYRARPGHRPGAIPLEPGSRAGGDTDVVRPMLLDPHTAGALLLSGEPFDAPIPHLRVRRDPDDRRGVLEWVVEVTADHDRPVPATLRVLGSPSMVVTVLELVPARRLRFGRVRFVRHGVEAIDVLAHRILQAAV